MTEDILAVISEMFDNDAIMMQLFVFCICSSAIVVLAIGLIEARKSVARRVVPTKGFEFDAAVNHLPETSGLAAAVEFLANLAGQGDRAKSRVLRTKLIQGGFLEKQALVWFFGLRLLGAIAFSLIFTVGSLLLMEDPVWTEVAGMAMGGVALGFIAPSFALDKRVARNKREHSSGFPDFMDLMVVCAQAGLSMEASVNRISKEIALAFPSLARNLDLAAQEIRSGKPLSKAMESLGTRLGIAEASSFATLLQQSEELGSSLSKSLRTYSDDMRNKRLMKAEEKAYALPAKLVVPLTLFVFPVLLVVLLLPVAVNVSGASV